MEIVRYKSAKEQEWDDFLGQSKNGTFHQSRSFISYHKERFTDHSLIVYEKGQVIALVPAAEQANKIFFAHPGLTYGSIVIGKDLYLSEYLQLFTALIGYLKNSGFSKFIAKDIPASYCSHPSGELAYAMLLAGAEIRSFDVLPHIFPGEPIPYQQRRIRALKKAEKIGILTLESSDLTSFWELLSDVLARHSSLPVHSLEEILELKHRFPSNIRLEIARIEEELLAGVVIFDTGRVERAQYIAASERGKETGALDLLFHRLIENCRHRNKIFEFGTTTLDGGRKLTHGLSDQKEGFGARTLIQYSYLLELANFPAENFPTQS
jgi:hypothetical protein